MVLVDARLLLRCDLVRCLVALGCELVAAFGLDPAHFQKSFTQLPCHIRLTLESDSDPSCLSSDIN